MLTTQTLKIENRGTLCYITFPNLCGPSVTAAFTTRMGGVSEGQYSTMNMSFTNGDRREDVLQNYNILFTALGLDPARAVLSHQTHTDHIRVVTEADIGKGIVKPRDYTDVDGLMTNLKQVPLVTQFADCVPLLFYDPVRQVIAASHAGWRGTFAEIGLKTVYKMQQTFGCVPEQIQAAIGPSIGQCCYEVDDAVYREIVKLPYLDTQQLLINKPNGKYMLNLQEANRRILMQSGLREENICVSDICTCCNAEFLHSHRATNGRRGNLAAVIALR